MSSLQSLQVRVGAWVTKCFGSKILLDKEERALRSLEEAIELAQAIGVSPERAKRLVKVVYSKPVGKVNQEMAGSLVTLLAVAEAHGVNLLELGEEEVSRIEALPKDYFEKRNIAKAADGVGNYKQEERTA